MWKKKILTPRGERILTKIVKEDRSATNETIKRKLGESGVEMSTRTLQRRLKELGYHSRRPVKKPKLTATMRRKRLEWAKKYHNFTAEDWKKVCFSDESSIQIMLDKTQYVRRKASERYCEDCIIKTVKRPPSVMIWSVISGKGLGRIYVVKDTMRQDQYKSVLETCLLPQLGEWFTHDEERIFMQDGAPCHTAKSIKKFLNDNNIPLLDWPGNSPDINPIENVWELLKREISKENITNKNMLIEKIKFHWENNKILEEMAVKCIESMPRRVQAIIESKGGTTKY